MEEKAQSRNLGIDALRCLAMLFITCLHVLNQGGARNVPAAVSGWLLPLKVLANSGVNLYALISGWVLVYGRFRPARLLELWLQVLFWNLIVAAVGTALEPGCMDGFWLRYCLPVTQKCYWYFTAYVGVYVLSPLLNPGIRRLTVRQARAMLLTMFLLFSLGTRLGLSWQGDPWYIGAGYSVLWLLALYVMGACARQGRLEELISPKAAALLALVWVVLICAAMNLLNSLGELPEFWEKQRGMLLYYNSPGITAFTLSMLLLFARLRIPRGLTGLIRWLSPLTFGVYILHVHHVVWTHIQDLYKPLARLPGPLVPLAVIAAGAGLLLSCAALDWLRSRLFRALRLRQRLEGALNKTGLFNQE